MEAPPRKPSRTAILTAVARSLHREEPSPWVLDDPLAAQLAGEDAAAIAAQMREELPETARRNFIRWVCVRSRATEDEVERAVAEGVGQYVILGAGLDSFAYRRPDLIDRLRIFEVDHPASQAWKRARLAELDVSLPANLVFAPVDFEHQTLGSGLLEAGVDLASPAVFSWLGVSMYLTLEAIESTLGTLAGAGPGSRVAMTYNLPLRALSGLGHQTESALGQMANLMGEPMISFFEPAEVEALLGRLGFVDIRHFGPAEAVATYFPGRDDVSFGGAQRLVFARTAPQNTA